MTSPTTPRQTNLELQHEIPMESYFDNLDRLMASQHILDLVRDMLNDVGRAVDHRQGSVPANEGDAYAIIERATLRNLAGAVHGARLLTEAVPLEILALEEELEQLQ